MAKDRFLIAPINNGLQNNLRPWLIPDDAFVQLQNSYIFRGRVVKRFGTRVLNGAVASSQQQFFTRVGVNIGTANGAGNFAGTVPGNIFKPGQIFNEGDTFTVISAGTPGAMITTGNGAGTYDTTNGAVTITGGAPFNDVYFYPAEPIMGIITYEQASINDERYIVFDTQFAYEFDGTRFQRLATETNVGNARWTGTNSNFFWGKTYRGLGANQYYLFVTNYYSPSFLLFDSMRYFDGTSWTSFTPLFQPNFNIRTCRCIIPFKGRLLLFNVVETDIVNSTIATYTNRVRWSFIGNPLDNNAWQRDINPSAGFLDADTREAIISVAFLKDRLMVFFERSTWELVYTGNQNLPFNFQRINSELGIESQFSVVTFDQNILGIGETGIYACNGSNVQRIDQKVPFEVFQIRNTNNGIERVQGIRDYFLELVYWTMPKVLNQQSAIFPNQVFVYNYRTNSWAYNDDSFTALGNLQFEVALTWATASTVWEDSTFPWNNAQQAARFLNVAAGNQEGFVATIDSGLTFNAQLLSITVIVVVGTTVTLTIYDHNLVDDEWILIDNVQSVNDNLAALNGNIFQVTYIDNDNISFQLAGIAGEYQGNGTVAKVTPIDILTKQYNFYIKEGVNFNINAVDFHVDKTQNGVFNVDYFTSTSEISLTQGGDATGASTGTATVETSPYDLVPYEQTQTRLWHRFYPDADGEFIQLRLYLSDENIVDPTKVFAYFALHGMLFHANPTASRLQ